MEASGTSAASVPIYPKQMHDNPEDSKLHEDAVSSFHRNASTHRTTGRHILICLVCFVASFKLAWGPR